MKVNLIVSEPMTIGDIGTGVFKTMLTHPKLEGALYFIHGKSNREETLSVITNSLMEDINQIVETVKDLTKK